MEQYIDLGGAEILQQCIKIRNKQGKCSVGEAVVTTAGNLRAQYVIHTVGPVWNGGRSNEEELLKKCYENSLNLAIEYKIRRIAFPNISTGIYRFPKEKAANIAIATVSNFILENIEIDEVIFVCFDNENFDIYNQISYQ